MKHNGKVLGFEQKQSDDTFSEYVASGNGRIDLSERFSPRFPRSASFTEDPVSQHSTPVTIYISGS